MFRLICCFRAPFFIGDGDPVRELVAWLCTILSLLSALMLGVLVSPSVQNLLHADAELTRVMITIGTTLGVALVNFVIQIIYNVTVGTRVARSLDSVLTVLITLAMVAGAGVGIYTYLSSQTQLSGYIAAWSLVGSLAIKVGSFLLTALIIPFIQGVPNTILGMFLQDRRTHRDQKPTTSKTK